MEHLIKWLKSDTENKFFTRLSNEGIYIASYELLENISIKDAKKICEELNGLLLNIKEGRIGRQFLIDFDNWVKNNKAGYHYNDVHNSLMEFDSKSIKNSEG